MKKMNYCILSMFFLSFSLVFQVNAQEESNVRVTIDNSNCNDNTLVGAGGGKCCGSTPCDCGCHDCCECFEARFESTFSFPNFNDQNVSLDTTLTLTPFIQEPDCRITLGDPIVITPTNNEISISQCLKGCLHCDQEYKVGYYITFAATGRFSPFALQGAGQTRNNDSVCACGKSIPMNSVPSGQYQLLGSLLFFGEATIAPFKVVNICCCDCPPTSCAGCSCLEDGRDCTFPFIREGTAFN